MHTIWTTHLTEKDEISKLQQAVIYSPGLDRLHEILLTMKSEAERVERSKEAYDNPNWEYRQAHRNGYISCLETLLHLTNPDQRKLDDRSIQSERPGPHTRIRPR